MQYHYHSFNIVYPQQEFKNMTQNQKKIEPVECQKLCPHQFLLERKMDCKSRKGVPNVVEANFSPSLINPHQLVLKKKKYSSITPKYNNDGFYFTPAFTVDYFDNRQTQKKKQAYQTDRLKKFHQHVQHMADLVRSQKQGDLKNSGLRRRIIQKKGAKNSKKKPAIKFDPGTESYCGICQGNFQNYWDHINSRQHLMNLKKGKANSFIRDICRKYQTTSNQTSSGSNTNYMQQEQNQDWNGKMESQEFNKKWTRQSDCAQDQEAAKMFLLGEEINEISSFVCKEDNLQLLSSENLFQNLFGADHYRIDQDCHVFDESKLLCNNYQSQVEKKGIWETLINGEDVYSNNGLRFDEECVHFGCF